MQMMPGCCSSPEHSRTMAVSTPACVSQFCTASTAKKLPESKHETSPCNGVLVGVVVAVVVGVVVAVVAGLSQSAKVPFE